MGDFCVSLRRNVISLPLFSLFRVTNRFVLRITYTKAFFLLIAIVFSTSIPPPRMKAQLHPPPFHTPPSDSGGVLTATFIRIGGRLKRMATQLLGDEAEADDALYEAFCRLWTRRAEISDNDTARQEALLTTTVRHLSIDTLRRRQSHPTTSLDASESDLCFPQMAVAFEEESETETERYERVRRLIAEHLTLTQQLILRRRDVEGASYADIAAETNLQEAAVRMQLSRARRTIRELYHQQNPSTP